MRKASLALVVFLTFLGFASGFMVGTAVAADPEIFTSVLSQGIVLKGYGDTLIITHGSTGPITWSIAPDSGELPPGLNLNPATGVISGTPTAVGTFFFTVMAVNSVGSATKPLFIIVNPISPDPYIITTTLPAGAIGTVYGETLSAYGSEIMSWRLHGSELDDAAELLPGLSLSDRGLISGIPTETGLFTFAVSVSNEAGIDTKGMGIIINSAPLPSDIPTITTSTLPGGILEINYSTTLNATGTVPINWSRDSGSLPPGLSLDPNTGEISGTPTTVGTFNFTVSATNKAGSNTKALSIVISTDAPSITTSSMVKGNMGMAYFQKLSVTGKTPIKWLITSGSLPPGLSLDPDTGVISGTPTATGTFNFTIEATNSVGTNTNGMRIVIEESGGRGQSEGGGGCNATGGFVLLMLSMICLLFKRKK